MHPTITTTCAILSRMFIRWRAMWYNYLFTRILEPVIFLYAMGFGLAIAYETVNDVPYLNFVIPGIMCSTVLYAALIDGAYGTLTREIYQGTWRAQLATRISLRQILLTEAAFTGFKSATSAFFILTAGLIMKGIENPMMVIPAFFGLWLGGTVLTMLAQLTASTSKSYEGLEYVWVSLITPMFLFSGVFIPFDVFPPLVQTVGSLLPLYHMVEITRGIMLQTASLQSLTPHLTYLIACGTILHLIAHHRYKKRAFA